MASHKPTAKLSRQIEEMAAAGVSLDDMSNISGISLEDIQQFYSEEVRLGEIRANVKVANNLFKIATGQTRQAVVAAQFWLRTRANWNDKQSLELSGKEGSPIGHEVRLDPQTIDAIRRRLIGD